MGKLITLILCLALALACAATSFAEGKEKPVLNLNDMGMKLQEPDVFENQEGFGFFSEQGVITHDPYFSYLTVNHLAFPASRLMELQEENAQVTEAEAAGILSLMRPVMIVFVTNSLDHAMSMFTTTEGLNPVEFAKTDRFQYYYVSLPDSDLEETYAALAAQYPDTYPAGDLAKWKAAAEKTRQGAIEALKAAEIFEPVDPAAGLIGQPLQFETTDLDGNTVKSGDLFSRNRMTMINVWGIWCPNCLNEMKELGEIHRKLQEKGCGVLGLEYEGGPIAEEVREKALSILKENGCDYPNVVKPESNAVLDAMINGYPTTIFVDTEGKVLTYPISGANVELYEETIEKLLSGEETGAKDGEPAASAGDARAYRIFVTEGGKPVEGAMIQFCSAEACFVGKTDADGMAVFEQPEGEYEVHVLKAPEGYAPVETTYKTPATYGDVNIALEPAK